MKHTKKTAENPTHYKKNINNNSNKEEQKHSKKYKTRKEN